MFKWMYRLLFGNSYHWALERAEMDGTTSRIFLTVTNPDPTNLTDITEQVEVLKENGWRVIVFNQPY